MELKATIDTASRIAAILHIQGHEGLDALKTGDVIGYASGYPNQYQHVEAKILPHDLVLAAKVRAGEFKLPRTAAGKMTAYKA